MYKFVPTCCEYAAYKKKRRTVLMLIYICALVTHKIPIAVTPSDRVKIIAPAEKLLNISCRYVYK